MAVGKTRIRQSPKLPPQQRRRQLLRAAGELFARQGYRGTSTEQIARRAGLTKGALYFHFHSKEDILLELVKVTVERHRENVVGGMGKGQLTPSEMLRRLLEAHLKYKSRKHMEMIHVWVQAWNIPRVKRYMRRRVREALRESYARLDIKTAKFRADRRTVMGFLLALSQGLSSLDLVVPGAVSCEAQVKLVDCLFAGPAKANGRARRKGVGK